MTLAGAQGRSVGGGGAGRHRLVLVAGADPGSWQRAQKALAQDFVLAFAVDLQGTLDLLDNTQPAVVLLCSDLLDAKVKTCVERMTSRAGVRVIVLLPGSDMRRGDSKLRGAVCIAHEDVPQELLPAVREMARGDRRGAKRACATAEPSFDAGAGEAMFSEFPAWRPMILGTSPAMRKAAEAVRRAARVNVTVLLSGETGTGKELFARRIHCMSPRARAPFRAVSLPAVPDDLFESIVFGHERGAFTGATSQAEGAFMQAHGGTLFLDEIASMGLQVQPKLLRAIQEQEVERVGGRGPIQCDVRVVAASNVDLPSAVERREFRDDLYHRLSVVVIEIPPLRDRREDIPLLVDFFLKMYAKRFGCAVPELDSDVIAGLSRYQWPGNLRELENRVQRALVLSGKDSLCADDFLCADKACSADAGISFSSCQHSLSDIEQAYIEHVLSETDGNQSRAAQILEIDRKTLRTRLQKKESQAPSAATLRSVR